MEDEPTEDWKAEVPRCGDEKMGLVPWDDECFVCRIFIGCKNWGCFSNDIGCLNLTPKVKEKDAVPAAK